MTEKFVEEFSDKELHDFWEAGQRAYDQVENTEDREGRICRAASATADAVWDKARDKLIQKALEQHPDLDEQGIEAELEFLLGMARCSSLVEDVLHVAGHFYITIGLGMAVQLEVHP